jgi:CelD/BcsL family acetyltransferase involved in cellulose biosynthesis
MREACTDAGFYWRHRPASFALATLPDTVERFLGSMSARHRGDLRKKAKTILEREGVAIRQCTRPEDVAPVLEALFDLHEQRWMAVGDPGAFRRKPAEAEFYRRFARLAFDRGWLRLYGLAENGQLKAVQIGYVYGGVFHSVQEGFDPQYLSGVGNVLRLKVVEHCIDSGIHLMDHLGDMTEHKRRWQAVERGGWDVFIGHRSVRNRLMFTKEVWPTGRFFQWSDAGR